MPLHDPLKHGLPIAHHRVPVAGDDVLKAPAIDPLDALVEPGAVAPADQVPEHPLLPHAVRVLQVTKQAAGPARVRLLARAAVLLGRGEVEEQVGLDERLGRPVEEHELLVQVGVNKLVVHVGVDIGRDLDVALIGRSEDGLEWDVGDVGITGAHLCALLWQAAGANDVRVGIGAVPRREEDMVLHVGRYNVGDIAAQRIDLGADGRGQSDGGEDEEGARGEFDCGGGCVSGIGAEDVNYRKEERERQTYQLLHDRRFSSVRRVGRVLIRW